MTLSQSEFAAAWLAQFPDSERALAAELADAVMLVSHDVLYQGLHGLLDEVVSSRDKADLDRPIALFAEREVEALEHRDKAGKLEKREILPFYPGTNKGRASGRGVPPIDVDPADQEVGSEGAIANFITSYERLNRLRVLNHPGPDILRAKRASHIVIVTDFIGSGKRVWEMIEAFWKVATVRSWHSYQRISFVVVAFSGTEQGIRCVRSHRSKPNVRIIQACPTLSTIFKGAHRQALEALCKAHPAKHSKPLGFGYAGALIAFSHGVPNNAPPILHSKKNGWVPLFVNRSALAADHHFPEANVDHLVKQARDSLRIRTAEKFLADTTNRRWVQTMLVLSALRDGARTAENVSARIRIPIVEVSQILIFTRIAHWTNDRNALTLLGRRELKRLRLRRARVIVLPTPGQPYYYPTQLRAR